MSVPAKITFGLCCAFTASVIGYVHYKQQYDREQLHLGVVRDIERQERRKAENIYILHQQQKLTKTLQQAEQLEGNQL